MYSCAPYATASGFVELPYLFLQSAVFMPITYFMIGFDGSAAKFFFFWLVFLMALTMNTFLGQLLIMVTPSQQVGQLLGSGRLNLLPICAIIHALIQCNGRCPNAQCISLTMQVSLRYLLITVILMLYSACSDFSYVVFTLRYFYSTFTTQILHTSCSAYSHTSCSACWAAFVVR